jgi:hypothetical protein
MRSSIRSLAIALTTVAAIAVAPLALDLRTGATSGDPRSASGGAPTTIVDDAVGSPGPVRPAPSARPTPDVVEATVLDGGAPASAAVGSADPAVAGAEPASLGMHAVVGGSPEAVPLPAAPPTVEDTPTSWTIPPADPAGEVSPIVVVPVPMPVDATVETPGQAPVADGAGTGGAGSGMGGDLPPGDLPTPPYPQCPITEAGPWWTDPSDPYTCIPPGSVPFHEPTPPGIPPELLEPIFEDPAPDPLEPIAPAPPSS